MNEKSPTPNKPPRRRVGRQDQRPAAPVLRISPTAWAKLVCLRDLGPTEVGGFAISAANDLLAIEDVQMVRQCCTPGSVRFDDQSVADYFDRQIDAGLKPETFSRIWVHTHPADSPHPSHTDEETFYRVFGQFEWAVMFILAQGGPTYARLRFNTGPGGDLTIPVSVDYSRSFAASDFALWQAEFEANVIDELAELEIQRADNRHAHCDLHALGLEPRNVADRFFDLFRDLEREERELFLEEPFQYEY